MSIKHYLLSISYWYFSLLDCHMSVVTGYKTGAWVLQHARDGNPAKHHARKSHRTPGLVSHYIQLPYSLKYSYIITL